VKCTACPEDGPEFQQLVLFPIQAAEHWLLLTYQPGIARLCACDSGVGKLFAHSDEDCASFITAIELSVGVDPATLSKNPLRLEVAVQPNSSDCGFHVVLNARSLTKSKLDRDEDSAVANLKDDRQPPSSALPEVRQYRKQL
jgi:Ulp1 family protease